VKIAVPTNDGATLSQHFGRSAAFLMFEVEDGRITSQELRANRRIHRVRAEQAATRAADIITMRWWPFLPGAIPCCVEVWAGERPKR